MEILGRLFRNIVFTSVFVVFLFGFFVANAESIDSFNSHIIVNDNGTLNISEDIQYDFGSEVRHGIFRTLPLTTENGPQIKISNISVTDESGNLYNFVQSIDNNILNIKIGEADKTLSGKHLYTLRYDVVNAIRRFDTEDELYWNVTGSGWNVLINSANVQIDFPVQTDIKGKCFTGAEASTDIGKCIIDATGNKNSITLYTTEPLPAYSGFTVAVEIPNTVLHPVYDNSDLIGSESDTASENTSLSESDIPVVIGSIFAVLMSLLVIYFLFKTMSKRFSGWFKPAQRAVIPTELRGKPIMVQYYPPQGLTPIDIGLLYNRTIDNADIVSVIFMLAVRGYLNIRHVTVPVRFLPDKRDFELVMKKPIDNTLHPAEQEMHKLLFTGRDSVLLGDLQKQVGKAKESFDDMREVTTKYITDNGYFDTKHQEKMKKISGITGGITAALFIVSILLNIVGMVLFLIAIPLLAILGIYTYNLKKHLPQKGIIALAQSMGFREFLATTEGEKLRLLNAPALQPQQFEQFLPYAIMFGIEKQWAQKFEGMFIQLNWYESGNMNAQFSAALMLSEFSSFGNSLQSVVAAGTVNSSSSGFGGGGFSGGGSGGGGGGSW